MLLLFVIDFFVESCVFVSCCLSLFLLVVVVCLWAVLVFLIGCLLMGCLLCCCLCVVVYDFFCRLAVSVLLFMIDLFVS